MSFDSSKSQVSDDNLAAFLRSELDRDLTTIPGIGQTTADVLQKNGISTSHRLLGFFLMLGSNPNALYDSLKSMGVKSNKSTIVHALATKADVLLPGTYGDKSSSSEDTGYEEDSEGSDEAATALSQILARLRSII